MSEKKLGITLITGFLGSGKTTLLNRILSEKHGRKIAVIENEFGEIGIDDELVKQQIRLAGKDERDFCLEMNNGCICCSVRADMAKAVAQMVELHRSGKEVIHVRRSRTACRACLRNIPMMLLREQSLMVTWKITLDYTFI